MPKCRACGSEDVDWDQPMCNGCGKGCIWGRTKSGDWILYDLGPPHFVRCEKGAKKRPKKVPADREAAFLRDRGYPEELIEQALKEAGVEED